jgi:multidrug efflux pump subunit AcrB
VLVYSAVANASVPIAQVASIVPSFTTREVLRFRRMRESAVMADITADRTLMAVTQDVEKAVLAQVTVPPGYEISFHGQHEEVTRSFISLARAAIVAIVLLDFINRKRREGANLQDAVVQGAGTRLRAISLTSLTTIGGLLPLTLVGGTLFAPFGWAMIFGPAGSTVLTLIVQPVAYLSLETWRGRGNTSAPVGPKIAVA